LPSLVLQFLASRRLLVPKRGRILFINKHRTRTVSIDTILARDHTAPHYSQDAGCWKFLRRAVLRSLLPDPVNRSLLKSEPPHSFPTIGAAHRRLRPDGPEKFARIPVPANGLGRSAIQVSDVQTHSATLRLAGLVSGDAPGTTRILISSKTARMRRQGDASSKVSMSSPPLVRGRTSICAPPHRREGRNAQLPTSSNATIPRQDSLEAVPRILRCVPVVLLSDECEQPEGLRIRPTPRTELRRLMSR